MLWRSCRLYKGRAVSKAELVEHSWLISDTYFRLTFFFFFIRVHHQYKNCRFMYIRSNGFLFLLTCVYFVYRLQQYRHVNQAHMSLTRVFSRMYLARHLCHHSGKFVSLYQLPAYEFATWICSMSLSDEQGSLSFSELFFLRRQIRSWQYWRRRSEYIKEALSLNDCYDINQSNKRGRSWVVFQKYYSVHIRGLFLELLTRLYQIFICSAWVLRWIFFFIMLSVFELCFDFCRWAL